MTARLCMVFLLGFVWCLGGGSVALAHPDAIVLCRGNIIFKSAKIVGKPILLQNLNLVQEGYDTNGDKRADVFTLSTSFDRGKTHNQHPVFWLVDIDHDGEIDYVYIDTKGLGLCIHIVLYQDLTGPTLDGSAGMNAPNTFHRGGVL